MAPLIFATSNEGKVREARHVLAPFGFEMQSISFDFAEPTSGTIQDVALEKLKQVMNRGYRQIFVEDSGIYFAAYEDFPGVLSKRVFQGIGYRGIGKLLVDERREAWFHGTVALYWHGEIRTFSATTHGRMAGRQETDQSPELGLPFDPIFIPEGEEQTFRELSFEKRLRHSYRKQALLNMVAWICRKTGNE